MLSYIHLDLKLLFYFIILYEKLLSLFFCILWQVSVDAVQE